jgi:hypothetical protein
MPYTAFTLPSGAIVEVESSRVAPHAAAEGPAEASTAADRAWKDGAALVAEVGSVVVTAMRQAFVGVDEVTVEFGANVTGKTGVILVEGSVGANLKVSVKWKSQAS